MARPIVWALGTAVFAVIWATSASDRLATRFKFSSARSPASASSGSGAAQTVTAAQTGAGQSGSAAQAAVTAGSSITLNADLRGHFVAHPTVDGLRVRMLVDTGASFVALSHEDAKKAGIRVEPRDFTIRVSTANGITSAAPVRIRELRVGDITVRNVDAVVTQQGALGTSLLGMSFLKRIGGFEVSAGRLTLRG